MNELKKILYNCRKATYLIEKQQIGRITLREKMELKIHLTGCSICKTFQRQSILINHMVKNLFKADHQTELKLDDKFKNHLQKRIEEIIEKKGP
ncbi:hypothetical protein [Pedobacter nutrimenti]|uniref:hypothetical protein n=1 Tax=Pedobacter nutrimenti TaxID=1241337 RepID=UPI0029306117|nr:hypothetical protein [Pedobacter nutrimenti]